MTNDLQAYWNTFYNHPHVILVILWGIWYVGYKRRALKADTKPEVRYEHRKRLIAGVIILIVSIVAMPDVIEKNNSPQRQTLSSPPATISPDTVYDQNDAHYYQLVNDMERNPDHKKSVLTFYTDIKDNNQNALINVDKVKNTANTSHNSLMSILDIMRCVPYARLGYDFKRPATKRIFQCFSWYHPSQTDASVVEQQFTPDEKTNVAAIVAFEKEHWNAQ